MRDALVRTPWTEGASVVDGPLAVTGVHWTTQRPTHALRELVHRDPDTGCVLVADTRLHGLDRIWGATDSSPPASGRDAVAILSAWRRWGESCVDHLDGDFAFAIYDPRRASLFLARDRMGFRPLYVHHAPGRFVAFASSTPALLAHAEVPRRLNEGRIADFLVSQLEGIDKTSTFHLDIERLPPAHRLDIGPGHRRQDRYWTLAPPSDQVRPRGDDAWADALTEALERAVARYLDGVEPVGCMISGGLDSSSLAVIASARLAALGKGPLRTFSLVDNHRPNVETHAIRTMLTLPGLAPHLVDLVDAGPEARVAWTDAWQVDEPFDALMLPMQRLYRAAADAGLSGLIDGVDGDSPFLMGNGMARRLRSGHVLDSWRNARGLAAMFPLGPSAPRIFSSVLRTAVIPDTLRRLKRAMGRPGAGPLPPAAALLAGDFVRRVHLPDRLQQLAAWTSPLPHWSTQEEAEQDLDHPYITVAVERYQRVAARHGVEPRHPFLDPDFLALCLTLPDRQRLHAGWSKAVLRRAMAGRLPNAVRCRRDKQHLGWTQNQALLAAHREELLARLDNHRDHLAPYVDAAALNGLGSAIRSGHADSATWESTFNVAQLGEWLARQSSPRQ